MPRFFFDTSIDANEIADEVGLEYPDLLAAMSDARRSLPDLVAEATSRGAQSCAVTVRDGRGNPLRRLFATLGEDAGSP
jgi:hypothetical protein